ncbi:MAG: FtsW/RodA/SpoVE family cell cycle protein [Cyanobacteria bacterium P01_H01_bin.121]
MTAWVLPNAEGWAIEARILRWLTLAWVVIGLLVMFSASYPEAQADGDGFSLLKRQLLWVLFGLLGLNVMTSAPLRSWVKASQVTLFLLLGAIVATLFLGIEVNGASRWLGAGPIRFQPSEMIKPFLVLQGAAVFSVWPRLSWPRRLLWLGVFGSVIVTILLQPNLSTAALCGMLLWVMALAAGLPYLQLISAALGGITLAAVSVGMNPYQLKRVLSFLNPWADGQEHGYQLIQSIYAVSLGEVAGSGYGLSHQKLFYLPFQHTDFIFSVFAEEFGLIGTILFLLFLLFYASLGLFVALKATEPVSKLAAIGAIILLVGQSMINIGVAIGVLPTTGLPLPFFSYGGNSMLACLLTAGILIRVARENREAAVIPLATQNTRRRKRQQLARRTRLARQRSATAAGQAAEQPLARSAPVLLRDY